MPEKSRLVATENGVGVNLNNITSTQRDISLTTAGKITLSNVKAQTDLNVSGQEIVTPAGSSVRAERDMTLAATTVDNRSNSSAHGDMRVFASTVRNTGERAALHSNNNLWIQKDAQGNKATLVENRSARIQTNSGDLVIRTNKLSNVRDVLTIVTQSEAVDNEGMRIYGVLFNAHKNGDIKNRQDLYQEDYAKREKWMLPCDTVEDCTYVTRNIDRWIPDERTRR